MCWKTALWPHLERAWKGWNPFEIRLLFGPLLVSLCFWMVCVAVKRFQDSPVGHVRRRASVECASIATVWINIHTRRRMWERTTELFKLTHWHRNNLPSIFSCYLPSHIHPPTILLCKIQHLMSICHPASDRHISAGALSLSIPHTSCRCYYRAAFYSGIPSSPTTSSCCYRRRRSRLSTVNSLGKAPSSSSCTVAAVKMVLPHLCCSSLPACRGHDGRTNREEEDYENTCWTIPPLTSIEPQRRPAIRISAHVKWHILCWNVGFGNCSTMRGHTGKWDRRKQQQGWDGRSGRSEEAVLALRRNDNGNSIPGQPNPRQRSQSVSGRIYFGSPVSAKPLHYLGFGGRVGNDLWINELSSSMGKEGRGRPNTQQ